MNSVQAAAYSEGFEAGKVFIGLEKDDEIAKLRAELEEAREALKPFAEFLGYLTTEMRPHHMDRRSDDDGVPLVTGAQLTMGDLRRARAFLDKAGK